MSVALVVITDGRDAHLSRCIESAVDTLAGQVDEWWMHDDTGDDDYRARLAWRYPAWAHVHGGKRRGFGGAIRNMWRLLNAGSEAEHILHLEQDFVFRRPVDLAAIAAVLNVRPHLAQMALRRQPWNPVERAAGGVVEANPDAYTEHTDPDGRSWLEHRLFWTTNPALYRRTLCQVGWPEGAESEGRFAKQILTQGTPEADGAQVAFGYWGARSSGEWVEHIGHERAGTGY